MTRTPRKRVGQWALQHAKAHFSGREEVVVVSVGEYRRAKGEPTGEALVELLHDSPLRDIKIERRRTRG